MKATQAEVESVEPGRSAETTTDEIADADHASRRSVARLLTERPEFGSALSTLVVFAFFSVWAPDFLTGQSIGATLVYATELGVIACPMCLLMIAGEIDLSVGSVVAVGSFLVVYPIEHWGLGPGEAILLAIAGGLAIGTITGVLVWRTGVPSFIITLAGMLFWRGAVEAASGGNPVETSTQPGVFKIFAYQLPDGILVSAFWFLGIAIVLWVVLHRSTLGNWIYASGGNERAARAMGIPVIAVRIGLFALVGAAATLVGVLEAARFQSADPTAGTGLELQVIAAVVVGGTRLTGGFGTVPGAVFGCLIIGMIENGLALHGVNSYWYQSVLGVIIVLAVFVNRLASKRSQAVS